jgi:hypothetical protein
LIDSVIRRGDISAYIETWRRLVNVIYRDAVEIGDSKALVLAKELQERREPVANQLIEMSRAASEYLGGDEPPREEWDPIPGRQTRTICADLESRLIVLARRAASGSLSS